MRLSFNEIRARASRFAADYADATYEKGETQTFYNDFFQIFGVQRRSVARYEEHVKKLNNKTGFIDLFWPRVLLVEQKSAGHDLAKAEVQAGEYFDAIKEADCPRFQLLCDFQTFQLLDRDTRETSSFALADLPKHVEKFGFIMGMEKRSIKDQDPVNIKAAELVGRLHDSLEASGYKGHQLEVFLTRIVFCLLPASEGGQSPDLCNRATHHVHLGHGKQLDRIRRTTDTQRDVFVIVWSDMHETPPRNLIFHTVRLISSSC